jgi:hypothetical protein
MKRKWLAIGIILLFVGVTIAPTINFQVVKATDDDLVEVTTQAPKLNSIVKELRQKLSNINIHQITLTLKPFVRSPPQRQGIFLFIYLVGLILMIPYLIYCAETCINVDIVYLIVLALAGIFWPISIIIFFAIVGSDPYILGKSLQNNQQAFSHLLSLLSHSMMRGIHV